MTEMRVVVGDITGKIIGEIEPDVGPVSWRINDIGRMQFLINRDNDKATRQFLEFGNRVLVQFSNGLPDWGGVIDTPREWDGSNILVNVYSSEYLMSYRTTDRAKYFSGEYLGEVFTTLLNDANSYSPTGLTAGWVWTGTDALFPEYHYDNLWDVMQDSICDKLSTAEFAATPYISAGMIKFSITLREKLGESRPNIALVEDRNVISPKMVEQGTIVNWWDVAGGGKDWGTERLSGHGEEYISQGQYGLRMNAEVLSDVVNQDALDNYAVAKVNDTAQPKKVFDLSASDLTPGKFADYGVGDYVRLVLPSYGFDGVDELVRVTAREFDPRSGFCRLVVMS